MTNWSLVSCRCVSFASMLRLSWAALRVLVARRNSSLRFILVLWFIAQNLLEFLHHTGRTVLVIRHADYFTTCTNNSDCLFPLYYNLYLDYLSNDNTHLFILSITVCLLIYLSSTPCPAPRHCGVKY